MGTWGSSLYSNDFTCDVRDTYIELLQKQLSNQEAYKQTIDKLKECLGSDEEPLFWFALADTQWRYGKLMPEVRDRALEWINKFGGLSFWTTDGKSGDRWKKTLTKLKICLESPQPREKSPKKVITNPWNVGDIYAYQFHSEKSKEVGIYGKYILLQKIADQKWYENKLFSRIQIYDKLFDDVPLPGVVNDIRVLPFDDPKRFFLKNPFSDCPLNMNAVMVMYRKSDYKQKDFIFIGNRMDERNLPRINKVIAESSWLDMEEYNLCNYFILWQDYNYEWKDNTFCIQKRIRTE